MEKIAIFDTSSGGTPTPPITTSAVSLIYGTYATNQRLLRSVESGFCNLIGGGNEALATINDSSVQGNYFSANYDIVTDFYISVGTINGSATVDFDVNFLENGSIVDSISFTNISSNSSLSGTLNTLTRFSSGSVYALRFSIISATSSIELLGWSIGVKFTGF